MLMAAIASVGDPEAAAELREGAADAVIRAEHIHIQIQLGHMAVDAAAPLRLNTMKAVLFKLGFVFYMAASTDDIGLLYCLTSSRNQAVRRMAAVATIQLLRRASETGALHIINEVIIQSRVASIYMKITASPKIGSVVVIEVITWRIALLEDHLTPMTTCADLDTLLCIILLDGC